MRIVPSLTILLLVVAALTVPAKAAPVVLVSIDGLRAEDILQPDKHGLRIPNLRGLMRQGVFASVKPVLPTLTYPNHTSLITGAPPATHGIDGNATFHPFSNGSSIWYWYAKDIRAETLWHAVRLAGGSVASILWPVSIGAADITYNIPEYSSDDVNLVRNLATPGLVAELENETGLRFADMFRNDLELDAVRTRFAAALYRAKHPRLMTLHLVGLDDAQHQYGPESPQAHETLERIDAAVGELARAVAAVDPSTVVVIVSDHGFAKLDHEVNLKRAFAEAGLLTLNARGTNIASWTAAPWSMHGAAAIMLRTPSDKSLAARVRAVLARLAKQRPLGINEVIDRDEIRKRSGPTTPDFLVNFREGFEMTEDASAPLVAPSTLKGMHGYFPEMPDMQASLIVVGPNLGKSGSLGNVANLDIAPTLAKILGVTLRDAQGQHLL